jgi:hypothetical protein
MTKKIVGFVYVSTHSHPWHMIEVSGDVHNPAAVMPGKELVQTKQQVVWVAEQF